MATTRSEDFIRSSIQHALEKETELLVNEAIELAKKHIEDKIRKKTAGIVMSVLDEFDVYRDGRNLVITVKHQKE